MNNPQDKPMNTEKIKSSKARTHTLRKEKHIKDMLNAKKRAIRNLKRVNDRLSELGIKPEIKAYCKEPGCKGDH